MTNVIPITPPESWIPKPLDTNERVTSVVKWFSPTRGYGFIASPNKSVQDPDIFLHATKLLAGGIKDIKEGQELSFVVRTDYRNRKYAAHIKTV